MNLSRNYIGESKGLGVRLDQGPGCVYVFWGEVGYSRKGGDKGVSRVSGKTTKWIMMPFIEVWDTEGGAGLRDKMMNLILEFSLRLAVRYLRQGGHWDVWILASGVIFGLEVYI